MGTVKKGGIGEAIESIKTEDPNITKKVRDEAKEISNEEENLAKERERERKKAEAEANRLEKEAEGGQVSAGKSYLVGEKGAEIFTPSSSGVISPNSDISPSPTGASGSGGKSTIASIIGTAVS